MIRTTAALAAAVLAAGPCWARDKNYGNMRNYQWGNGTDNATGQNNGGAYRSMRAGDGGSEAATGPGVVSEDEAASENAGPATLGDARGSFDTLMETWLRINRSRDGRIRLKDPDTGKESSLRFIRVDPTTVHQVEPGLFAGDLIMSAENGAKAVARAVEDLRTSEWLIAKVEIPSRKQPAPERGAGRFTGDATHAFAEAVMAYVKDAVKRDGVFLFQPEAGKPKKRLRLKMLESSQIKPVDASHYQGPAIFTDLDDKGLVEVEFYVSMGAGSAHVYKTESSAAGGTP